MKAAFVTGPLRDRLKAAMKAKPIYAAVAYVSDITDLPLGAGDLLVCDASPAVARAGSTVRKTLRRLVKSGVSVWSLQDLHAKVVVCGKRAIIGSANWSNAAETRKVEAGIDTDEAAVVAKAKSFVQGLLKRPGVLAVDKSFLRTMPDPEPRDGAGRGKQAQPTDGNVHHWLMPSGELPETPMWQNAAAALEEVQPTGEDSFEGHGATSWYIYSAKARNVDRVQGGDTLTVMWQSDEGEVTAYPPRLVIRTAEVQGFIGFLTLEAVDEEKRKVPLDVFEGAARKAGVRKNFTKNSYIGMSASAAQALEQLWTRKSRRKKAGST